MLSNCLSSTFGSLLKEYFRWRTGKKKLHNDLDIKGATICNGQEGNLIPSGIASRMSCPLQSRSNNMVALVPSGLYAVKLGICYELQLISVQDCSLMAVYRCFSLKGGFLLFPWGGLLQGGNLTAKELSPRTDQFNFSSFHPQFYILFIELHNFPLFLYTI